MNNNESINIEWNCPEGACDEEGPILASPMELSRTIDISLLANNGTYTCTGTVTGGSNVQPVMNITNYNVTMTGNINDINTILYPRYLSALS